MANGRPEQLVTIIGSTHKSSSGKEVLDRLHTVKREVASAISKSHGSQMTHLVLVPPGSTPITAGGQVRGSVCGERYRQGEFDRLLDAPGMMSMAGDELFQQLSERLGSTR